MKPEQLQSVRATLRSPRRLKTEALAGLVVALALIPEAIAFSVIAGVDPRIGLFASFTMAVTISFVGGRPAMISAATGAVALVIAPLMRSHGLDHLIAAVILAGRLPDPAGRPGRHPADALHPALGDGGLRERAGHPGVHGPAAGADRRPVAGLSAGGRGPGHRGGAARELRRRCRHLWWPSSCSPLFAVLAGVDVPAVQDKGQLPESLPSLFIPNVPLTWETFQTIAPFSLSMALVGLLESLMTAKLVDDITDTRSNKTRESWGQGVANIVTGFLGGMGGCAVIGQTMINVKGSGARSRVSTFLAGVFLLVLVVTLGDVVGLIPMAALVAVMIFVSAITFDWHSIAPRTLQADAQVRDRRHADHRRHCGRPTHNLAIGVGVGVLAAMAMFARRVAHFATVERTEVELNGETVATYTVDGELFFASSNDLYTQFEYARDAEPRHRPGHRSTCTPRTCGTPPPSPCWTRSPRSTAGTAGKWS